MRHASGLAVTAFVVAACATTPAAPSPATQSPAVAETTAPAATPSGPIPAAWTYVAELKPGFVVPPVTDSEATCTGTGTLIVDTMMDNYKIVAATARIDLLIAGCPSTTKITGIHIHKSEFGTNGDLVADAGQKPTEPIVLTNGATQGTITKTGIAISVKEAMELTYHANAFYFEVHSELHPTGVLRGQLRPN